jgi:hypothetical protein
MLAEQVNVARVEPLGLVEIRLARSHWARRRATEASHAGIWLLFGKTAVQSNAPRCRNP